MFKLSEYARGVGKSETALRFSKEAAVVFENLEVNFEVSQLLHKTTHLAAIHEAPADDWQWLRQTVESIRQ